MTASGCVWYVRSVSMDSRHVDTLLRRLGVDLWGVAANDPPMPLAPPLPRAVSLIARHHPEAMRGIETRPTAAYYADYQRLNRLLDAAAARLVAEIRAVGRQAEAVDATIDDDDAVEDWTHAGVFAHKTAATRAGLGWIGKTALLVTPRFGTWVRLATVFTDLRLPVGASITRSRCNVCRACVDACPAGAGRDVIWSAGAPRERLFDAQACTDYTERYDDLGGVCGACTVACPFGTKGAAREIDGGRSRG